MCAPSCGVAPQPGPSSSYVHRNTDTDTDAGAMPTLLQVRAVRQDPGIGLEGRRGVFLLPCRLFQGEEHATAQIHVRFHT